jgi:glycosyltransferase involved in cell wall biosynthesis
MAANDAGGLRVVVAGVFLDPERRHPRELLKVWRDFGRVPAAAGGPGGAQVTIVQAAWEDHRCEIGGAPCFFVREEEPPFVRLPGRRQIRRVPRRLFQRIADLSPDVIHYEGLVCPRLLRALARSLPCVPILSQDHFSRPPQGWRRWLWRWGFAPLAGVTFTARAQADPFKTAGVLRRDLPVFEVIEGSTPFTPGDRLTARAATGLDGDPCLLWVGNLDARKDPLMVLDAVARATSLPNLRLHMCYRYQPLLGAVRARVADPSLTKRVALHGEIEYPQIEAYFRAADFLVQASHEEGSGYGVIEALACGTTPLLTDIPPFRRITGDGEFGALVPLGDSGALARAITEWSRRDPALLRHRAREHFERSLSFDAIGRQLLTAYRQVHRPS